MNNGSRLTDIELVVLQEVARGRENRQIAITLFRSPETVRTHMKSILRKLGARNRTHAVAIAYHVGIFQGRSTQPDTESPSPLTPTAPRRSPDPVDREPQHPAPPSITSAPSPQQGRRRRDQQ